MSRMVCRARFGRAEPRSTARARARCPAESASVALFKRTVNVRVEAWCALGVV